MPPQPLEAPAGPAPFNDAARGWLDAARRDHFESVHAGRSDGVSWTTGQWWQAPSEGLATASWDGSVVFDPSLVATINEAFENAGEPRPAEVAIRERLAFGAAFHEFGHHLSTNQQRWDTEAVAYGSAAQPAWLGLEEGITDMYSNIEFNAMAERTGLDQVAPGITDQPYCFGYPVQTAGAYAFVDELARLSGQQPLDVLREVHRNTVRGKWLQAAEMVVNADPNLGSAPRRIRQQARTEVAHAMVSAYNDIDQLVPPGGVEASQPSPETVDRAERLGRAAVEAGVAAAEIEAETWTARGAGRSRGTTEQPQSAGQLAQRVAAAGIPPAGKPNNPAPASSAGDPTSPPAGPTTSRGWRRHRGSQPGRD